MKRVKKETKEDNESDKRKVTGNMSSPQDAWPPIQSHFPPRCSMFWRTSAVNSPRLRYTYEAVWGQNSGCGRGSSTTSPASTRRDRMMAARAGKPPRDGWGPGILLGKAQAHKYMYMGQGEHTDRNEYTAIGLELVRRGEVFLAGLATMPSGSLTAQLGLRAGRRVWRVVGRGPLHSGRVVRDVSTTGCNRSGRRCCRRCRIS